ncbi:LacI family DNA-binding transcriptional regulator [Brachybacterium sacelli]|uniref:DNA-binding LacI/PurR family transcriptional regulator n=1 Tax=Brachybacterium sacelli TaxID=173364 RepID=A0ABS4WXX7_9MICO|nr:LacI family DNA-binding transcriptional regulator [Brachybacterium sacelli]MBP2381059.1 DNA-binding LacI/PurR family transcriptional regulator [Brachybacterium sacelli]
MTTDRRSPRPRLTDVAAVAGVSMKTVSNVMGGYAPVSEATRAKVLAAVDQVRYRPNLSARNLARGRSGVIALTVPRLDLPYFASLAGSVVEAAGEHGWFVLMHQTGGDLDGERRALLGDHPQRLDGMILSTQWLEAEEIAARPDPTPLVVLGDHPVPGPVPHVGIDNHAAGLAAAQHLLATGRRRIALIGAPSPGAEPGRAQGLIDGVRAAGLPVLPELTRPITANTGDAGESATARMLAEVDEVPDALFAVTDWVAMGAIRALHARGLAVPRDVAVMGFDDIPYARSVSPSLTTIAPDREAVARSAVEALEAQVGGVLPGDDAGPAAPDGEHFAPFELVVRESTGTGI